jgi:hypothetical protein
MTPINLGILSPLYVNSRLANLLKKLSGNHSR